VAGGGALAADQRSDGDAGRGGWRASDRTWAEEEFLATIRRGRLERAAQVLPRLERDRLVALLSGEVKAGMI
jgi:hypothetical protein